jgi:hypothetical protein
MQGTSYESISPIWVIILILVIIVILIWIYLRHLKKIRIEMERLRNEISDLKNKES